MNPAYKHLSDRLRIGELDGPADRSSLFCGLMGGLVFALYLSPFRPVSDAFRGDLHRVRSRRARCCWPAAPSSTCGCICARDSATRQRRALHRRAGRRATGYEIEPDEDAPRFSGRRRAGARRTGGDMGLLRSRRTRAAERMKEAGRAPGGRGDRPHRPGGHERGRVRAGAARHAAEPADPLRGGARADRARLLPSARRGCARTRACSSMSQSRPINLEEILAGRAQAKSATPPVSRQPRWTATVSTRSRCRGGGCMRRWRSRCACTPTNRRRSRPLSMSSAPTCRCAAAGRNCLRELCPPRAPGDRAARRAL